MTKVQEAGERDAKEVLRWTTGLAKPIAHTPMGASERLASFVLRLTDPTPLTPELLKRVGFVRTFPDCDDCLDLGPLRYLPRVAELRQNERWEYRDVNGWGSWEIPHPIWPRTLGELRMLAMRLSLDLKEPE